MYVWYVRENPLNKPWQKALITKTIGTPLERMGPPEQNAVNQDRNPLNKIGPALKKTWNKHDIIDNLLLGLIKPRF